MILCDYGCGKEGHFKFKNGKYCCSESQNSCSKVIEKLREGSKGSRGYHHSKDTKQKIRESKIGEKNPNYGKCPSEKTREKMRKSSIGMYHSEETKKKLSKILKGRIVSKNTREKLSNIVKRLWKDPNSIYHTEEYIKNKLKSENLKPNKQEIIVLNVLNKLFPNEYYYVGNYKFWLNGKNPDFINYNKKKIIEFFGYHWHSKEFTGIEDKIHEIERIDHFKKEGYDTLIIWDYELKNLRKLKDKMQKFQKKENQKI